MAYALDSNCLLRWLLNDNPDQARIVAEHIRTASRDLQVADMAIVEAAWVLKSVYGFDDVTIEGFLRKIIEHQRLSCNRALFVTVLDQLNTSPKVSLIDLCLAQYAKLGNARLLTFDKALAKKLPKTVKLLS